MEPFEPQRRRQTRRYRFDRILSFLVNTIGRPRVFILRRLSVVSVSADRAERSATDRRCANEDEDLAGKDQKSEGGSDGAEIGRGGETERFRDPSKILGGRFEAVKRLCAGQNEGSQ